MNSPEENPKDFVISANSDSAVVVAKNLLATFPKLEKSGLITPCPLPAYFNIHRSGQRYSASIYVLNSFIDPELKNAPIYPFETKVGKIIELLRNNTEVKKLENTYMKEEKKENPANFVIYVPPNNKELAGIIIDLLAKYNFSYTFGASPAKNDYIHSFRVLRKKWFCHAQNFEYPAHLIQYYNDFPLSLDPDFSEKDILPHYDASTQIGEIIRILQTPLEPDAPKPPVINGWTMEYDRDKKLVKFGCAEIPSHIIGNLVNMLQTKAMNDGNRRVISITLNSGKVITTEQIKEIHSYIKELDKTDCNKWNIGH